MKYRKISSVVADLSLIVIFLERGAVAAENQPHAPSPTSNSAPRPPSNVRISVQRVSPAEMNAADPTLSPTGRTAVPVGAALDAPRFTPTLRSAAIAARPQVLSDLEARLGASELALDTLEKSSPEMSMEGRARLRQAADQAKESAKSLRQRLREARSADERAWNSVRSQLADDYIAYAEALSRIDRVAGVPTR